MEKVNAKVVLLNGPAGCGKGIVISALDDNLDYHVPIRSCKDHLITLTISFFRLHYAQFMEIYCDREMKEVPREEFAVTQEAYIELMRFLKKPFDINGLCKLSIREAMIYVSEFICKPTFGIDYFGVARAEAIEEGQKVIDDSCGFEEELPPLIERVGQENILLIRIKGRGSFEGDSRDYISDGVVDNTVDVENTGDEDEYLNRMVKIIDKFYKD